MLSWRMGFLPVSIKENGSHGGCTDSQELRQTFGPRAVNELLSLWPTTIFTLRQIKSVEQVVTDGRRRESLMTKRVNRSEKSLRESHIRKYGRLYTVITWKTSHPIPRVSLDEQWKEDNRSEQPLYGLWTWRRWTGQAGPKQTKQLLNKTSSCFVQQLLGLNPLWSCRGQTQEQSSPNINVSFLYSNKAQCWRLCVFIMNTCVCSSDCVSVIQCLAVTYRLCVVRCNHVSPV